MTKSSGEIVWDEKEERELGKRILKLSDTQIGALLGLLAGFKADVIKETVAEIRKYGLRSGHLPILLEEVRSMEELLWWVNYFEGQEQ